MNRPKLFLDTDICIKAGDGRIPGDEWRRVRKHISAHYRYHISFITMKELFVKLSRGDDRYFQDNKRPLDVLYGSAKRRFLPYPSVFALRTVLGMTVSRKSDTCDLADEKWAEFVLTTVLQAPSKAELRAGIPVRNSKLRHTVDLDHFDDHEDRPQKDHADLLQGIREGRIDMTDPVKWAAGILDEHALTPYTKQCEMLVAPLDAAYRYSLVLSKFAANKDYDFHKQGNISAWGDNFQLFYLCDPEMQFLTSDTDFPTYTQGSPQASRILMYNDFVQSISTG